MMIKRTRRKMSVMVPIASMGDIAFLLIIFFILASNFAQEAHIDFDPAKSPDIEKMERSQVSVTVDKDGQIWLQGEECPVDLLDGGVKALLDGQDNKVVMLTVHRELPHGVYGEVFLKLSEAGAEIALVGVKKED
jgi:biopolymer transport protein ExbD